MKIVSEILHNNVEWRSKAIEFCMIFFNSKFCEFNSNCVNFVLLHILWCEILFLFKTYMAALIPVNCCENISIMAMNSGQRKGCLSNSINVTVCSLLVIAASLWMDSSSGATFFNGEILFIFYVLINQINDHWVAQFF